MKNLRRFSFFPLLAGFLLLHSCSGYQKVVKSNDYNLKLEKAKEYYSKEQYFRAQPLFEELLSVFKGTNIMQDVLYYYAYCHYHTSEFLIAAYHFKNYANTYVSDPRAEECLFMAAKSYSEVSPNYMLEQNYTYDCIEAIQLFVNSYPQSIYVAEANGLMDQMRDKLEKKALYNANLYYKMGKYKSAKVAYQNLLRDFPDIENAEEITFLMLKSDYLYALNSIPTKQEERFQTTVSTYQNYNSRYNGGEYSGEAKDIYETSIKNLNKFKTNEQE